MASMCLGLQRKPWETIIIMDKVEYLLACVGEECGKVQKVVGKAQRFGIFNIKSGTDAANIVKLRNEVHDVLAAYVMLCDEVGVTAAINRDLIDLKKEQVTKYMALSMKLGCLDKD